MSSPARLVRGGERSEIPPGALRWYAGEVEEDALAPARAHAYATGRVLEGEWLSVLTWGEAARLELRAGLARPGAARSAVELLAAIPGAPGGLGERSGGPIALGALPFSGEAPGELVLPAVALVARAGAAPFAIVVAPPDALGEARARFPLAPGAAPPSVPDANEAPDAFRLASARPHADFRRRVLEAVRAVEAGELAKVVLAREVVVRANRPFRQAALLERLRALHPSCLGFAVDGFVGASPELLCRVDGATVTSQPLAGTTPRSGDPDEDARLARALRDSAKERREHAFVVEAIAAGLAPFCRTVRAEERPHLLELRNVAHLATRVEGELASSPRPSALEIAAALHPTPAVGGTPRDAALEYLAKHEDLERDRFAGPVGFVQASGDGEFWIGIRSALVRGTTARLFAGVGIVAGSDPDAELAETQLKLQALLAVAVRP
ncbi:MAG TPA: isochorismate synthase [Acidimicrobiales bacterium]|nr:isochorismate synthase [Acidimicrobiales bacterium]